MTRVAINGLGRIGRAALKIILDKPELKLTAVNDLVSADNLAYLLNYDTVYGRYQKRVTPEKGNLSIDGLEIPLLSEKDPANLPWDELNVDTVFECTGLFRDRKSAEKHLQAGAKRVIISAPAKGEDVVTTVYGVNTPKEGQQHEVISCASCTTNCITPLVEIMGRRVGVAKAIMTTIHAYTSTQGIVDGPNSKKRRGRAAAANLVPTSTGAAIATTKVLPHYKGLFDGAAVRVPIPVGSLTDITFVAERKTTVEEVNEIFREEVNSENYRDVVAVSEDEIVSADIVQDPHASIVDLSMTQVVDGDLVKMMSWYDNEWGYANQMIRTAIKMGNTLESPAPIAEREVHKEVMSSW